MCLMKLRTGATNLDLAERLKVSEGTVSSMILTWINYLYVVLGSIKIWPHRDILLCNQPEEFKYKYPICLIIVDATELKIQVPSALQKHSAYHSTYKSSTTFKSLIGVDAKGGKIFVSHLYYGFYRCKKLIRRPGFLDVLRMKIKAGEVNKGDSIVADKGFDIESELKELGLELNIPPFLKDNGGIFHSSPSSSS